MSAFVWAWPAVVVRVIDGDTVVVDADLGMRVRANPLHVRLAGINTPEPREPGGPEATARVRELLPAGALVVVRSYALDKYGGRILGDVLLPDGRSLTAILLEEGLAVEWGGTGPRPVPQPATT